MDIEQRANIKFCVKLNKSFIETYRLMKHVHGVDRLSRAVILDWYMRFKNGRENLNDGKHINYSKFIITTDKIRAVREFIESRPESSMKLMEIELNIPRVAIYRIMTKHLGLRKLSERFISLKMIEEIIQQNKNKQKAKNRNA